MFILQNIPLNQYSTMRLGGLAAYLTEITESSDIKNALDWAKQANLPVIMIGEGSNIIWRDEGFPGLVMVNKIQRYDEYKTDEDNLYVTAGAGESWDSVVERTVTAGYSGLEELSLIPGSCGATPVQNVGAYGKEISDVLVTVEAFDTKAGMLVTIANPDCNFGYRTSRFKTTDKDRFFITAITLHVYKAPPQPPFYESLHKYFKHKGITKYTAQTVRDAVITIRSGKLPDPKVIANNGSFFENPVINQQQLAELKNTYPNIVYWEVDLINVKLSAAWLIEQAGFKNFHDPETGMATWYAQPLVFVNEKATSTNQLLAFKKKIVDGVQEKFGITLEQEPQLLP